MITHLSNSSSSTSLPLCISGVYPHLCAYTFEPDEQMPEKLNECGIGAVVPWAGKLWMITYGAHYPNGSTHKLYSINNDLSLTIHPESIGGTPAGRMLHKESDQLIIGPYFIDANGGIRVIPPERMPARVTAVARHLTTPETHVYIYDMEGMLYEVNVHDLAVKKLCHKPIPGDHGKGGYTAQGRLVVSNNGENGLTEGPEDAGCLAEWDGQNWDIVERRQYCDVTGPNGIEGADNDMSPLWAIGWDRRSLRLKLREHGRWYTYLLPKAAHNNDARHGWYTEWPRIREIAQDRLMMDMHGMFYEFPKTFSASNSKGIAPISSHLRYIPDFCNWNGKLVIATDETDVIGHRLTGQPQSNLWIGSPADLKQWGPATAYGGPWVNDPVSADQCSDPFLIAGFDRRMLHLITDREVEITIEIDEAGTNRWETWKSVGVKGYAPLTIPSELSATWCRVTADRPCTATAYFHGTQAANETPNRNLFASLAGLDQEMTSGLLYANGENRNLSLLSTIDGADYAVTRSLTFQTRAPDPDRRSLLTPAVPFTVDEASVLVEEGSVRYRLPKGDSAYDAPFECGWPRALRQVESERTLAQIHGTFYEIPRACATMTPPDWSRMRPVSSHSKKIHDYCTWQGLLVISGVRNDAPSGAHVIRSADGDTALWCGAIDDLWQLGKPCGEGGPWHKTSVKASEPSDPYLMTGYDRKTLTLQADKDVKITVEVDVDHQSGWHAYQTISLKPGTPFSYEFPREFSAHWVRFIADDACTATAWLTYS